MSDISEIKKPLNCPTCKKEFGLFRWEYKCDNCHNIFCDDCLTKVRIDYKPKKLCQLCKKENDEKIAKVELEEKERIVELEALYKKNLNSWVKGTKQEYIRGFNILDEWLIECNSECASPAEVEEKLKYDAVMSGANGYIKFFWDKKIEHHDEEYIAGFGKKMNPYYKTRHYTTQYFIGHAYAVIIEKNNNSDNDSNIRSTIEDETYKYVIECSQKLEKYIEQNLKGRGKGLDEKITSIEDELSAKDLKRF